MSNSDIQQQLIIQRLLDPPADGAWGRQSVDALKRFQILNNLDETGEPDNATKAKLNSAIAPEIRCGSDFAGRVIQYMLSQNYWVPIGERLYTIAYIEGCNADGTLNNDTPNEWNDRRLVIEIPWGDRVPRLVGNWKATSEPGRYYTEHPMNRNGCARIAFGQYQAWQVGRHGQRQYEALVQSGTIKITRDYNQDYARTGDSIEDGVFGINQHHGYDCPVIEENSAGCLVGQSIAGHEDFMQLVKGDRRYQVSDGAYTFWTAIIPGDKLP